MITVLFSIKYVSRVNFDSTYRKIKVENTILRFQFHLNILLLEQRMAKINSHQKFQSSRTVKICSRKPQKIANPQNKTPAKFSCYTVLRLKNLRLPNFNMLFQLVLTKNSFKSELFSCLPMVNHVIKSCKEPIEGLG